MDKSRYLIKNILIYGIGNLAAKLISVFLFPLYTYYVLPKELGYYDISLTIVFLIIPFYTFQLREGVFRFILEENDILKKLSVYKYAFRRVLKNTLWLIIFAVILSLFYAIPYIAYIVLLVIINGLFELISFILRVESKKYFVLTNVLSVLCILFFSYVFLVLMDMGIKGIYLSNIIGRLISLFIVEIRFKLIYTSIFNKSIIVTKELSSQLFKYSVVLIPLAISAFFIEISNKLFIQHYLGLEQNGIYAISSRFVTIILFLAMIFHQAWQETAIKEYESEYRDSFFSQIFNTYILILSFLVGGVSIGLKIFYPILIAEVYQDSLQYIYPLFIGVVFSALVSFLDLGYQCSKQTNRSMISVVYSILINIILNYILINMIGLYGIVISYCLTYMFIFVYRFYDTKRFFSLKWDKTGYSSVIVFFVSGVVFYTVDFLFVQIILLLIIAGMGLSFLYKKNLIPVLHKKKEM